jgi:hypothetical protein
MPAASLIAEQGSLSTGQYLILFLVSGGIGAAIGSSKNRAGLGFVLGLLLGCLGWIIILLIPRK